MRRGSELMTRLYYRIPETGFVESSCSAPVKEDQKLFNGILGAGFVESILIEDQWVKRPCLMEFRKRDLLKGAGIHHLSGHRKFN